MPCFELFDGKAVKFQHSQQRNLISVPNFTFIFTPTGFYTFDCTNHTFNPMYTEVGSIIMHSAFFADKAICLFNNISLQLQHFHGSWTTHGPCGCIADMAFIWCSIWYSWWILSIQWNALVCVSTTDPKDFPWQWCSDPLICQAATGYAIYLYNPRLILQSTVSVTFLPQCFFWLCQ